MSIPLDRLYQYIESVAQKISESNVIIYHFYPHGSKNINNLITINSKLSPWVDYRSHPQIYCHDQEPLNYDYFAKDNSEIINEDYFLQTGSLPTENLRHHRFNIYDKCILLHSELNSVDVTKYQQDQYIPVYYWSHGIIARDWFRYAQHVEISKRTNNLKKFLIYNRAWSGTREYRLKFIDLLINANLIDHCHASFNPIEPELQIHYSQHQYINLNWRPKNQLENYLEPTKANSSSSADFDIDDYISTEFEVVLETLYDDQRIQLTEKILRPIACNQPFLLVGSMHGLQYLRRYGFKTFGGIFDEGYDNIKDPQQRMNAVLKTMSDIVNWSEEEQNINMRKINEITKYNQAYFFSDEFFNKITDELKENLMRGLTELRETNTGNNYISLRKMLSKNLECRKNLTKESSLRSRQEIVEVNKLARIYYNRYLKTLNK